MTDWQKKYRWVRTWGDETGIDGKRHEDYVGYDGEENIGRIFLDMAGPTKGLWRWAGGYEKRFKGKPMMPNSGYCKTAAEAAQTVERYWDEMKALNAKKSPEAG